MVHEEVTPEGWPRPKGYANAVLASGRTLFVSGQIGWDETQSMVGDDFVAQVRQALRNIVSCLRAAGAGPEHLARLTWYVTDREAYVASQKEIGRAYREEIGRFFPAMSVVQVTALVEPDAKVEIEATAVVPE